MLRRVLSISSRYSLQRLTGAWQQILILALITLTSILLPQSAKALPGDSQPANGEMKAADPAPAVNPDHAAIEGLLAEIESLTERVAELEARSPENSASSSALLRPTLIPLVSASVNIPHPSVFSARAVGIPSPGIFTTPDPISGLFAGAVSAPITGRAPDMSNAALPPDPAEPEQDDSGHNMSLPGGPKLNIRGFLDFNFDAGSVANPLIYPLAIPPPTTVHDAFQFGEFDLFLSSKLSNTINFLSEMVFGADASNDWGIDIERAQLTYKPSQYFQISGGRMHTAIGYYNTAYHHGTWFQTATGRPYMYYYEDAGGILPVHIIGLEAAGSIPKLEKVNAHWIAEVGNGESSSFIGQPIASQPVQNFVSDTDHKAFNIAGYVKLGSLQIGGNYYSTIRVPDGMPHVNNAITGAYVVYLTSTWEFFNELQIQRDHLFGSPETYNTPLGYTQISRKFGKYRPYFRWQEVNVPVNDPLYSSVGRYEGPSFGLRMDLADYAALKVQYNRVYTRDPLAKNGLDSQVSFTF